MEYAYATCILTETGEEINEENLTAVLEAAGCAVIESRVKAIVAALEDVDVSTVTAVDVADSGTASSLDEDVTTEADGRTDNDVTATGAVYADTGVTGDQDSTETSGDGPATEANSEVASDERTDERHEAGLESTDGDGGRVTTSFDEGSTTEPSEER